MNTAATIADFQPQGWKTKITQPEKISHIFPKKNLFLILWDGTFQRQAQKEKKTKFADQALN